MDTLGFASTTDFSVPVELVSQGAFLLVLGMYAIFSAILYYHWQTYSTDDKVCNLTIITYFLTTVPLLIAAGIMLLII